MTDPKSARHDGRGVDDLRPVSIQTDFLQNPAGHALIRAGNTVVLCTASVEEGVPRWRSDSGLGWLSAEYSMLPGSTHTRSRREASRGKQGGRTLEIQRLIGRSLRAVCDFEALGERSITIDCDVLQADGGTRTASITGGFVALARAIDQLMDKGLIEKNPLRDTISAVSVGLLSDEVLLDLCYVEDSAADVDMNVVVTGSKRLVEVQGTAEGMTFSLPEMNALVTSALRGAQTLKSIQLAALSDLKHVRFANVPRLILATRNQGKVREMRYRLSTEDIHVGGLDEVASSLPEVDETGTTFLENAALKASSYGKSLGTLALADDSGLAVDALDGAPGLYSARFAGPDATDSTNIDLLLDKLRTTPDPDRTARFHCAVALYVPAGVLQDRLHELARGDDRFTVQGPDDDGALLLLTEATTEGQILHHRRGEGGFGYDPVFLSADLGKTFGQASREEKANVSHRGRALEAMIPLLARALKSVSG